MGGTFTSVEAKHKSKQWCMVGASIPDGPGVRDFHMQGQTHQPRLFAADALMSEDDMDDFWTRLGPWQPDPPVERG